MLAKQASLLVGEMRFRMNQRDDAVAVNMLPGLLHEAPIEIWLQASQERICLR